MDSFYPGRGQNWTFLYNLPSSLCPRSNRMTSYSGRAKTSQAQSSCKFCPFIAKIINVNIIIQLQKKKNITHSIFLLLFLCSLMQETGIQWTLWVSRSSKLLLMHSFTLHYWALRIHSIRINNEDLFVTLFKFLILVCFPLFRSSDILRRSQKVEKISHLVWCC